jgi:hypothetical protein
MTQAQAAEKSLELTRDDFARLETGIAKGTSARVRMALARCFRLRITTVSELLDGQISLEEAIERIGEPDLPASPRLVDRPEWRDVLPKAVELHRQFFGPCNPAVWAQLGQHVLDSVLYPRPLTPAFLARLAHAVLPELPEPPPLPEPGFEHVIATVPESSPPPRR